MVGYLDKPLVMPLSADSATTEKLEALPQPSAVPIGDGDAGTPSDLTAQPPDGPPTQPSTP